MKKKIASILLLLTTVAVPAICDDTQTWSVTGISTDATSALGYSAATTGDDDEMDGVKQILFNNANSSIPYRIPAIAQALNGDLIALTDYRQGKADIGLGAVDIHAKISRDNGSTWGSEFCIAGSTAVSGADSQYYGDASIVADSESNNVLALLVCGGVGFVNSTRDNPIRMSYVRASYNPETDKWTWAKPVDITSTLYNLLPTAKALFCTSGKICQSKKIKVGDYYRIYTGLCVRTTTGGSTNYNWVLYSDDFGETWKVLGSNTTPAATASDECKCEELPNGNVVLSSRVRMGRIFNIFTYTNQEKATGSWGAQVGPSESNGGIYYSQDTNPCNGEILLVNAIRNSDKKEVTLALHSIAYNRRIAYVYYKALESESDYNSPSNFAKDWEGSYLLSTSYPCYSTMVRQNNKRIGLYFEESSYNSGYNMVYYRFPLEKLTNNAYSLASDNNLLGDANGDGKVDISDVTTTIDRILKDTWTANDGTFILRNADVNADDKIDISDVTGIIDIVLGREE